MEPFSSWRVNLLFVLAFIKISVLSSSHGVHKISIVTDMQQKLINLTTFPILPISMAFPQDILPGVISSLLALIRIKLFHTVSNEVSLVNFLSFLLYKKLSCDT